ncbi:MAG: molybdopterin molybdotransferase MoeA [Chloroflexi bacterium]|nr:molybdopterin molybdotransferase MoeA [Chloroflexota bacterium]
MGGDSRKERAVISVEEALGKILSYISVLEREAKPLLECLGQVLAEDVYSTFDVPPLDNSAMDGYAVQARSTGGASPTSPRFLSVIGQVAAGYLPKVEVRTGTAVRIMTGAPLPKGADAVVPFEDTDEVEQKKAGANQVSQVAVFQEVATGTNVRQAGEDIARGQLILEQGTILRPAEVGVLASLGRAIVSVIRRPVVVLLATGDELVEAGEPLAPGKIYNSNSYSLASQVRRHGGVPHLLGIAKDDLPSLEEKLLRGLEADLFVTSAGVSRGDYDVVKEVLAAHGQIAFWTVCMRPGKPLAFGTLESRASPGRRVPHLGLPGNPVSSMITFEQFGRPAIRKMMGKKPLPLPTIRATLEGSINNDDGRRVFARAQVWRRGERYFARIAGPQGSGILTSMAYANGLVVIPEGVPSAQDGDMVQVQMLDWSEDSWLRDKGVEAV